MKKKYSIYVEIIEVVENIVAEDDNEAYQIAYNILSKRGYDTDGVSYISVEDFEELEEQLTLDI